MVKRFVLSKADECDLPISKEALTDDYVIECSVGRGATSSVFRGKDLKTGQYVAIKTINKLRTHFGRMYGAKGTDFKSEIELMARLDHPNIVKFIKYYNTRKDIHIVMEYAWGQTLSERIEKNRGMPEPEAKVIVMHVVNALKYLHEQNCVHRDVKAGNVLLMRSRTSYAVKLSDFGLSKFCDVNTQSFVGTPHFMAPEILEPEIRSYGAPVDAWALGVLLYQMLSGRHPFEGQNTEELLKSIKKQKVTFTDRYFRGASVDALNFIGRLLNVDPEKRMTMAEAAEHPWLDPVKNLKSDPLAKKYAQPTQSFVQRAGASTPTPRRKMSDASEAAAAAAAAAGGGSCGLSRRSPYLKRSPQGSPRSSPSNYSLSPAVVRTRRGSAPEITLTDHVLVTPPAFPSTSRSMRATTRYDSSSPQSARNSRKSSSISTSPHHHLNPRLRKPLRLESSSSSLSNGEDENESCVNVEPCPVA